MESRSESGSPDHATGEEAYSIAMICAEQTFNLIDMPRVEDTLQPDIDEDAIMQAREKKINTLNDAAEASAERLNRFFTKEGERYGITRRSGKWCLSQHIIL